MSGSLEKRVARLAAILEEKNLQEMEVSFWGFRLRLTRDKPAAPLAVPAPAAPPAPPPSAPAPSETPPTPPTKETPPPSASSPEDLRQHPGVVTSPMVGVIYLAPEPGAKPFISVGDDIAEGQTLLIVEAMKTMNMIPAPRGGRLTRLLVENGQAVEYGEPLLILE